MIKMKHISLKGTYYEMGNQYGNILKQSNFKVPKISQKERDRAIESRQLAESYFPECLEEIRGIADTSKFTFDDLSITYFNIMDMDSIPGCSIFAVKHNNQTYIGRNYDMYYFFHEFIESYYTEPANGYKSVGQSSCYCGKEDGINEKGLGVAQSGIISYLEPGLPFWAIVRFLLDKCSNVSECIDFLLDVPHFSTMTYLLADAKGNIAIVEASPKKCAIRYPEDDFLVSTNHYNHPDMQDIKLYIPPDSNSRYNYICNALQNRPKQINEENLKKILSNHDGLVCSHRDKINLGTLWSTVANLNTLKYWRSEGHPCSHPYELDKRWNY